MAKCPQVPSDATVRKRFFCDNFVIFHRRSQRIAFFGISDGHVTTFWHPSAAYICQMTLQTSKRHTFRVSAFHHYHWFGVKLIPVGYAQDSRSGLVWSHPSTDSGLSRPTGVFRTTIGVCKILSRSVEIWQYEGEKPVFE